MVFGFVGEFFGDYGGEMCFSCAVCGCDECVVLGEVFGVEVIVYLFVFVFWGDGVDLCFSEVEGLFEGFSLCVSVEGVFEEGGVGHVYAASWVGWDQEFAEWSGFVFEVYGADDLGCGEHFSCSFAHGCGGYFFVAGYFFDDGEDWVGFAECGVVDGDGVVFFYGGFVFWGADEEVELLGVGVAGYDAEVFFYVYFVWFHGFTRWS